jgi:GntR family transcriptional repressor for pyruvate dehydrogenase complex
MAMLPRLQRETLAERVESALLEYIQRHDLKPGALLPPEAALTAQLGVSRAVVREALKSLQGRGTLQIVNGKGAIVRPSDPRTLRLYFSRAVQIRHEAIVELMETRCGLEAECAELAATRRTAEELAGMEQTVTAMRARLHDSDAYADLDVALHLLIAAASHNTMLAQLVESLRAALQDTVREGLRVRRTDAQMDAVQESHERIVVAIGHGDPEEARRAMATHLERAIAAMNAKLDHASTT